MITIIVGKSGVSKTKVNTFLNYKDGFTDKKYVRDLYLGNKSRSKNVKK